MELNDYVNNELTAKLKDFGLDNPTLWQAQKFVHNKGYITSVRPIFNRDSNSIYFEGFLYSIKNRKCTYSCTRFKTYEEALEKLIDYALIPIERELKKN